MKLRPLDGVAVLLSAAVIVLFSVAQYGNARGPGAATVTSAEGEAVYALSEDQEIRAAGPLGETVIRIEDGKAIVLESPCRDKLCVLAGELSKPGDWTACLPNGIMIRLSGAPVDGEVDETSY